jgi:hypothetical protein
MQNLFFSLSWVFASCYVYELKVRGFRLRDSISMAVVRLKRVAAKFNKIVKTIEIELLRRKPLTLI